MLQTPCPSCQQPKGRGKYLCLDCWRALPMAARRILTRRDSQALARLRELHKQLEAGVPLGDVTVSP